MTVNKNDEVLWMLSNGYSQTDIMNNLSWKSGTLGTIIRRLMEKEFLTKLDYGKYKVTKKGLEHLKKEIDKNPSLVKIDKIVNQVVAVFTNKNPRIKKLEVFLWLKDTWKPPKETEKLRDVIKSIYMNSTSFDHAVSDDLIISMWSNHRDTVCKSCRFDFDKSYMPFAKEVEKFMTKEQLFENLRWQSFSDGERLKHGLNMKSNYTPKKISHDKIKNTKDLDEEEPLDVRMFRQEIEKQKFREKIAKEGKSKEMTHKKS